MNRDRTLELVRCGYPWAVSLRRDAVPTRLFGRRADPNRFLGAPVDPDTLVPQGSGDVTTGHRCPGEGVTLTMLAVAVRALARLPHTIPAQDLGYDITRVPTLPRSRVVLSTQND